MGTGFNEVSGREQPLPRRAKQDHHSTAAGLQDWVHRHCDRQLSKLRLSVARSHRGAASCSNGGTLCIQEWPTPSCSLEREPLQLPSMKTG